MILYWYYVIYPRGGAGEPCTPLFAKLAPSCALCGYAGMTSCLVMLSCIFLCRMRLSAPIWLMYWGRGGGFSCPGDLPERSPEEVEPGTVFPLRELDANLVRRHPGPHMHRCVARNEVMETLLLMYTHFLK